MQRRHQRRKVELVVEDSQASNTVAINALNKVLQSNPIAVFGPALGTQVLAMMPIIEREKIPLIAGPSTRRVTQQDAQILLSQQHPRRNRQGDVDTVSGRESREEEDRSPACRQRVGLLGS